MIRSERGICIQWHFTSDTVFRQLMQFSIEISPFLPTPLIGGQLFSRTNAFHSRWFLLNSFIVISVGMCIDSGAIDCNEYLPVLQTVKANISGFTEKHIKYFNIHCCKTMKNITGKIVIVCNCPLRRASLDYVNHMGN